MKLLFVTLSWVFGLLLLLVGVTSLNQWQIALPYIGAAFFVLPPIRQMMHRWVGVSLPTAARAIVVVVLLGVATGYGLEEQKRADKLLAEAESQRQAEIDERMRINTIRHYDENRVQILADAAEALDQNKFQEVINDYSRYLVVDDEGLNAHIATAKVGLAGQEAKAAAAEARKNRIKSQFSAWDGSHNALERIIKDAMNDPGSYEHVSTAYWDRGDHLIVQTTFRGKNAFGALMRNSVKARVTLDGIIEEILEQL